MTNPISSILTSTRQQIVTTYPLLINYSGLDSLNFFKLFLSNFYFWAFHFHFLPLFCNVKKFLTLPAFGDKIILMYDLLIAKCGWGWALAWVYLSCPQHVLLSVWEVKTTQLYLNMDTYKQRSEKSVWVEHGLSTEEPCIWKTVWPDYRAII